MNYILFLAAAIGAIVYMMIDYVGEKGNQVFTKKYLLTTLVNIIVGCVLIWATKLKEGILQIGYFDAAKVLAMFFGIAGQKLFKTIIDITDSEVKTKLGINKKLQSDEKQKY
jgi:uncharacterized metal-binding protein